MASSASVRPSPAAVAKAFDRLVSDLRWRQLRALQAQARERTRERARLRMEQQAWDERHAAFEGACGPRPRERVGLAREIEEARRTLADLLGRKAAVPARRAELLRERPSDAHLVVTDPPRPSAESVRHAGELRRKAIEAQRDLEQSSDVCPHCKRGGWTAGVDARRSMARDAITAADLADAHLVAEAERLRRAHDQERQQALALRRRVDQDLDALQELEAELEEAHTRAARRWQRLQREALPARRWDARRAELGDRPVVPEPIEVSQALFDAAGEAPTPLDVQMARSTLASAGWSHDDIEREVRDRAG